MEDIWEPPADAKIHIVCAANKLGDLIIPGARHFDNIMHGIIERLGLEGRGVDMEQGFIDQFGRFYNREEAMNATKQTGQPVDYEGCGGSTTTLYSEGLY